MRWRVWSIAGVVIAALLMVLALTRVGDPPPSFRFLRGGDATRCTGGQFYGGTPTTVMRWMIYIPDSSNRVFDEARQELRGLGWMEFVNGTRVVRPHPDPPQSVREDDGTYESRRGEFVTLVRGKFDVDRSGQGRGKKLTDDGVTVELSMYREATPIEHFGYWISGRLSGPR